MSGRVPPSDVLTTIAAVAHDLAGTPTEHARAALAATLEALTGLLRQAGASPPMPLTKTEWRVLRAIGDAAMSKDALMRKCGWEPTGGAVREVINGMVIHELLTEVDDGVRR